MVKIMMKKAISQTVLGLALTLSAASFTHAAFVHPGITHKQSDLDRMKYMVESQIEPWYSSYEEMAADSKASYTYTVQGKSSFTELGRDSGVNYGAWNSDIRAAYYNAIRWYITGDTRHAEKAIEIFKAWSNLTSVTSGGTESLSGGVGYIMIEAAELIKSTYDGWSDEDIQDFSDMLVYPGYSTTSAPSGNATFYWKSYQGDAIRHGNQGLSGFRTVMAMGIFLDNEIMYDRALRYIKGQTHRADDLAYPAGPNTSNSITGSDSFADTYSVTRGYTTADYGYNEVMTNYIWDNGQIQESSRDHQHTAFGLGLLTSMAEMAWNQGDDLYGHADSRLLLGLEYNLRYNVSAVQSFPDQSQPWNPTVASGEFRQGFDRTGRWYSKAISTIGAGDIFSGVRPVLELPVAHYIGRGIKSATDAKWTLRGRDLAIDESGYEVAGWSNDAIGWGALTARRPDLCYGDPISGFDNNGLPVYAMNVLPMTIEAENFDYSPIDQNGRTYSDTTTANRGNQYRTAENVDIQVSDEGGYNVGWIADGEWLSYTVYVPTTANYDVSLRVAAPNAGATVKVLFDGEDKSGFVNLPATGDWQIWDDVTLAKGITLNQGVQSMRIQVGAGNFNLNNITVALGVDPTNLALGKTTSQSSTGYEGDATRAVDGNTDGKYTNNSVTHSASSLQPWWQVDLGSNNDISTINIWNRTDCCSSRLSNYYVLVSDNAFTSNDLTTTRNQAGVKSFYFSATASTPTQVNVNSSGRYVRVQLEGTNALSLAEVEVFGTQATRIATSSSDDGNVAANVLDNDLTTRWSANGSGEWLQIDMGSTQSLSGAEIAFYNGDQRSALFDLQVSNNGSSWTTVLSNASSSGSTTATELFAFNTVQARYIRYVGNGNSTNTWNSVTSVNVITN